MGRKRAGGQHSRRSGGGSPKWGLKGGLPGSAGEGKTWRETRLQGGLHQCRRWFVLR